MKIAIITGANKGIGYAIAKQLSKNENIKVILTARKGKEGQQAADELGAEFLQLDITNGESVDSFIKNLPVNQVDYLINNAGIYGGDLQRFPDADLEVIKNVMETNVYGHINVTQKLLDMLRKSPDARIINISSGMGQFQDVGGGALAYRMSKAALNMFTANAAAELSGTNVKIVAVCPGWVQTDMGGQNASISAEESAARIIPLLEDPNLQSGEFYRYGKVVGW